MHRASAVLLTGLLMTVGCTKSEAERNRYAVESAHRSLQQMGRVDSTEPPQSAVSGDPDAPKPGDGARYAALNVALTSENATRVLADADPYLTQAQHRLLDEYKRDNTSHGELYWKEGDSLQALLDKQAELDRVTASAKAQLAELDRKNAASKLSSAPTPEGDGDPSHWYSMAKEEHRKYSVEKLKVTSVRADPDQDDPYRDKMFIATGKSLCYGTMQEVLLKRPESGYDISQLRGNLVTVYHDENVNIYSVGEYPPGPQIPCQVEKE